MQNSKVIASAMESWLTRQAGENGRWKDWTEEDAAEVMVIIEAVNIFSHASFGHLINLLLKMIVAKDTKVSDIILYRSWIRKISRHTGALPSSFILKGVTKTGKHAIAGGGFAGVYCGNYAGKKVVLKVLKETVTEKNRREIVWVCLCNVKSALPNHSPTRTSI